MITKIEIENFQNHKHTVIVPSEKLTVISGPSDNGKSAVFRAIQWCLFNKPDGDSFRRKGANAPAYVRVEFDNSQFIERKRGTSINEYRCGAIGEEGQVFTTLGRGNVPDEIYEISKMEPINIQGQFDSFFLISESGGATAKALNSMVGLEQIDTTIKNINSSIKAKKSKSDSLSEEIKGLNSSLNEIPDLSLMEELISKLEDSIKEHRALSKDKDSIELLLGKIKEIDKKLQEIPDFSNIVPTAEDIRKDIDSYEKTLNNFNIIDSIVETIGRCSDKIKNVVLPDKEMIKELELMCDEYMSDKKASIDIERILNDHERYTNAFLETKEFLGEVSIVKRLERDVKQYNTIEDEERKLRKLLDENRKINEAAEKVYAIAMRAKKEKEELMSKIDVCPVCEKPMNGECC